MNDDQNRTFLQTPEQWMHFVSSFVHELRTPIASSRMLADLLNEAPPGQLGEQQRNYCENLLDVVQDLQALVADVGTLTRLLGGRVLLRSTEISLEQLSDRALEATRTRAWEAGIVLTTSTDSALQQRFRTDPDRLQQALVLLLGAAIDQARSEVFLRLDAAGGDLRAVISSDGPAFTAEAADALFEPFHDAARATRMRGGRNLSLPLASELVRALGGTLRAQVRGERPTFDLSIPPGA